MPPALPIAGWITPVPGGVGPMTIACLLANTVTTASLINGLTPPEGFDALAEIPIRRKVLNWKRWMLPPRRLVIVANFVLEAKGRHEDRGDALAIVASDRQTGTLLRPVVRRMSQ